MNKKASFMNLGVAMANVNHIVTVLEGIGLTVDDASFDGKLYETTDVLFKEVVKHLDMSVSEENEVCNLMMSMDIDDLDKLEEVWNKYGLKQDI